MAAKWSNEYVVAEHKDLQASTMALDSSGQYVLLAGRRCLAIVDVDNPSVVIKKFPRQSKWEVGSAEWNPHSHLSHLCAISSNQRTEILSWNSIDFTPLYCLRFHTRAVSDLNWHHFEPYLLASCSVDTYINIWDIRDPRKPCVSLSAVVGATQVRWNRVTSHLLATAHEGDVRLWDWRKGSSPVQYIAAHLHKIHGLDWSANQEYQLATSSQDCTVKFFDVNNPRVVENALRTVSPVWRARFTPFGDGMMTTQLRRGENSLLLWSLSDLSNPVHSFLGNNDLVLEFDWKSSRSDDDDYQLITWSKDQSLRIWRVDVNLQKLCGYEPENQPQIVYEENESTYDVTAVDAISTKSDKDIEVGLEVVEETYLDLHHSLAPSIIVPDSLRLAGHKTVAASIAAAQAVLTNTLSPTSHRKKKSALSINSSIVGIDAISQPEHYSFNKEIDQLKSLGSIGTDNSISVCDVDETQRSLTTVIRTAKHQIILHISMPPSYPDGAIPNFLFGKGTTIDNNARSKMLKVLKQAATLSCRKGHPSIELVLQQLLISVDQLTPIDKSETESSKTITLNVNSSTTGNTPFRLPQTGLGHPGFLQNGGLFGSLTHHQDHNIPYPRSSGARFCSAGMLICFGRPSYLRRVNSKTSDTSTTPRSLSVNQAYSSNLVQHSLVASSNTTPYGLLYPPVAQSPTGDPSVSISSFYNQDRRQKSRTSKSKNRLSSYSSSSDENKRGAQEARHHKVVGMVTIYDASGLMPQQLELAERYVFSDTDTAWMCNQNAAVAAQFGRKDLTYIWSLGALLATPTLIHENNTNDLDTPWAQNPFGRKLLHAIIDHYVKLRDIQTVAMLCCAFGYKCDSQETFRRKTTRSESGSRNLRWGLKPGESPYHTIHPGDTTLDSWNVLKQIRSNSWSDSLDDFRLATPGINSVPSGRPLPIASIFLPHSVTSVVSVNGTDGSEEYKDKDFRLLDPKFNGLFDNYRRCYADILYRWGLLEARVLVLKYLSTPIDPHRGVDFVTECVPCRTTVRGPQCTLCKRLLLNCVICRVVVKGSASFCLVCGHGGHGRCMSHWFTEEDECPTGCGCNCLLENNTVFSV
ncbi:GATOR complex protein WDR59-like isoform X2 [Daphnia pulex]|nr:GATOR complex protein WDR59-like isoform X2 [Daphnia pulex]